MVACSNQSCGSKALSTDSVAIKASMYSRLGITLMHQNARPFLKLSVDLTDFV